MIKEKYIENIKQTSVKIVKTEIESIKKKDITKTGLRIFDKEKIGVTGAIGHYDKNEMEKKAIDALNSSNISYPYEISADKQIKENIESKNMLNDDQLIEEVDHILEYLRKEYSDFTFSESVTLSQNTTSLKNDKGLDLSHMMKYIGIGLIFKEKASSNIFDGGIGYMGTEYDRNEFFKLSEPILKGYRNKIELPKEGKLPVVFLNNDFTIFTKFFRELNGLIFGSGGSLFSDKKGQKIFSEKVNLYQGGDLTENYTPFFDAEGTVNTNYRYDFIKNGVIVGPYTDKKVANMFNLPLTGSAGSAYDGVPTLSLSSLALEPSDKTIKELLNGEKAIFIVIAAGGDFTPEGNFASPVQLSFLFEDGEIIGRLPQIQVSSSIFNMFGDDYRGVSKDKLSPITPERYVIMDMNVSKL